MVGYYNNRSITAFAMTANLSASFRLLGARRVNGGRPRIALKSSMLYLASQSPRRKELLRRMGIQFRVVSSSYRERVKTGVPPSKLVMQHAQGKAKKAIVPPGARWILGADTVVYCRGRVLGKPKNYSEAFKMIRWLSGKNQYVYTGVVLLDIKNWKMRQGYSKTKIQVKDLPDQEIRQYLKKVNPLDKAGGCAIEQKPAIARRIRGSYTNILGLPVELVKKMLKQVKREKRT